MHKKHFAFEEAVEKRARITQIIAIIVLYVLVLGGTTFFTIFVQITLIQKTGEFIILNEVLTTFSRHTSESQMFNSNILRAISYSKGNINKEV